MQFSIIAMLGLSAFAMAAPAPVAEPDAALIVRGGSSWGGSSGGKSGGSSGSKSGGSSGGKAEYCCASGSRSGCSPCGSSGVCPSSQPESYSSCSMDTQIGLLNVFVCDVLNDNTVSIPVTLNVLS